METIKKYLTVCLCAAFLFGLALLSLILPDREVSPAERRRLEPFPAFSAKAVASGAFMEDFESWGLDQFPGREAFRTLKSALSFYVLGMKDQHGIYIQDGQAAALEYPADEASLLYAAGRFRRVYERCLEGTDCKVYLSVIPDKGFFLTQDSLYPSMDYEAFTERLRAEMEYARYIDIFPSLSAEDYYRTDIHWRQENLPDTAKVLLKALNAGEPGEYRTVRVETPFYGVYYGQSALPLAPDTLYYLDNDELEGLTVYDYETKAEIPLYNLSETEGNDPYALFLSGSKSLITIENPASSTDRELILFRDSFGSSIAPLLCGSYRKVTLVDIRYIAPELLERFLTFSDQDVLFLYSISVLNHSASLK